MQYILSILFTVLCFSAHAAVWENTNTWDETWELKYQEWVRDNWDKDFFTRDTIYKNLKLDCADVVYSMRYIFAADNGLPFVVTDPTNLSGRISNSMTRWDKLSEDKRKRNFLEYLYGVLDTRTLVYDTYPVRVSRESITSGGILQTDAASHHSWTIKYISDTGIPYLVYSSRPAKTMFFSRYEYPTTGFTFPKGLKAETNAGFKAFKKPEELDLEPWEIPGYSLDQYSIPLKTWAKSLQQILQLSQESIDEVVRRELKSVCDGSQERVDFVNDALVFLKKNGGQCLNAANYDDLSTPSRDKRLLGSIEDLKKTYADILDKNWQSKVSEKNWDRLMQVLEGKQGDYCLVTIAKNTTITLHDIVVGFEQGIISSNPHDSLEARWGLTSKSSKLALNCPMY